MTGIKLEDEKKALAREYKELLRISYQTLTDADKKLIRKAFDVAVEAHKDQNFVVKWDIQSFHADAHLYFDLDSTGKANHLKMKAISPLTDFSYDFHDLDFTKVAENGKSF